MCQLVGKKLLVGTVLLVTLVVGLVECRRYLHRGEARYNKTRLPKKENGEHYNRAATAPAVGYSADVLDYGSNPARVGSYVANNSSRYSWAYASVAAIEGQQEKHGLLDEYGRVIPLDTRELIQSWNGDTLTTPTLALYHAYSKGLPLADKSVSCPKCTQDRRLMKGIRVFQHFVGRAHKLFPSLDQLLAILAKTGPLMVGLSSYFIDINRGKDPLDCRPSTGTDHFVLLTGYTDKLLVFKNSWGADWGRQGYGSIKRIDNCNPFAHVIY